MVGCSSCSPYLTVTKDWLGRTHSKYRMTRLTQPLTFLFLFHSPKWSIIFTCTTFFVLLTIIPKNINNKNRKTHQQTKTPSSSPRHICLSISHQWWHLPKTFFFLSLSLFKPSWTLSRVLLKIKKKLINEYTNILIIFIFFTRCWEPPVIE